MKSTEDIERSFRDRHELTPVDLAQIEECQQCGSLDKLTGFDLIEQRCPQTGNIDMGGRIHLCRACLRYEGIHDGVES